MFDFSQQFYELSTSDHSGLLPSETKRPVFDYSLTFSACCMRLGQPRGRLGPILGRLEASQRGRPNPFASPLASFLPPWQPLGVSLACFGSRVASLGLLFGDSQVLFGDGAGRRP